MSAIYPAGSGRMRFSTNTGQPVPSWCFLSDEEGDIGQAQWGGWAFPHWSLGVNLNFPSSYGAGGLMEPNPNPGYGRPYDGIRANGTGHVRLYGEIEPHALVRPFDWVQTIGLFEDGAMIASQSYTPSPPNESMFNKMVIDIPDIEIHAGSLYRLGWSFNGFILIGVWGPHDLPFYMYGDLTAEGEQPSIAMRGSGRQAHQLTGV